MSTRTPVWICHHCATGNLIHLHERCRLCGHNGRTCNICTGPSEASLATQNVFEDEEESEEQQRQERNGTRSARNRYASNSQSIDNSSATPKSSRSHLQHIDSQRQQVEPRRGQVNPEHVNAAAWVTNNRQVVTSAEKREGRDRSNRDEPDLGSWSQAWWSR